MVSFKWRMGTVIQQVRELLAKKPTMSFNEAKNLVMATTRRFRSSKYTRHQGEREKARRRRQMTNCTHGYGI